MNDSTIIRLANTGDVERMAELCGQLGYPSTPEELRRRLERIQASEQHAVYVAEGSDGQVIGWMHVCLRQLVMVDPQVEVAGLVVAEGQRSGGLGRRLIQQAEAWARQQGCAAVTVRSNVVRQRAHTFYQKLGYQLIKTSLTFLKHL